MCELDIIKVKNEDGIRDCLFFGDCFRYNLNLPSRNGIGYIYMNRLGSYIRFHISITFKNKDKFFSL